MAPDLTTVYSATPAHYEQTLAAMVLWREARGLPPKIRHDGYRGILHVILNRMRDQRWPDQVHAVILQPYQFSSFNYRRDVSTGQTICDPNSVKWPSSKQPLDWAAFLDACAVAADPGEDNTGGANHYHDDSIDPPVKAWLGERGTADQLRSMKTVKIGPLVFYKIQPLEKR